MKRTIAFALAVVMLFAFAACSSKKGNDIKGTWKGEVALGKVTGAMSSDAAPEYVVDLVKDINVGLTLVLEDDGNFVLKIDGAKLQEDFKKVMKEKLPAILAEQMNKTEEEIKEALAAQNKSIDDMVDELMAEDNGFMDVRDAKGTYKYENGKLYLKGENSEEDGFKNYVECTLEGNKLTATGVHSEEDVDNIDLEELSVIFPLVFTR